ncbi:MAG: 30S ribosomal protein S16 [gamma proteobacterium endosymbiont of Trioza apicalis]
MVIIRLTRCGRKKLPFYQIIVTDKRKKRDGEFIERIGFYNPVIKNNILNLNININRIDYWVKQGAEISKRVSMLINKFKQKK